MRTVWLLIFAAALAVAGWFVYQRYFSPTPRACASVGRRCGLAAEQTGACERVLTELGKADGEAAHRLASCLEGAKTCAEAAGCATGAGSAVFSKAFLEFVEGLRKAR